MPITNRGVEGTMARVVGRLKGQLSDHLVQITRLGVETARALAADEIILREGAEVVVRVLEAPGDGGRGLISLAGRRIPAQLPSGVGEGQRLRVVVQSRGAESVLLRIIETNEAARPAGLDQLAAALALSGDPELVRVAFALSGGAVPLPGGGAGALEVDPDGAAAGDGQAEVSHARVTLHSPELGPIEIGLTLSRSAIAAAVTVEPGRPQSVASAASPDLLRALERSTGRQDGVSVAVRPADERRPPPPIPIDWIDVRA